MNSPFSSSLFGSAPPTTFCFLSYETVTRWTCYFLIIPLTILNHFNNCTWTTTKNTATQCHCLHWTPRRWQRKLHSRTQGQTQAGLGKSSVPSSCDKQDRTLGFDVFFHIILQELKTESNPCGAGKLCKPADATALWFGYNLNGYRGEVHWMFTVKCCLYICVLECPVHWHTNLSHSISKLLFI